MSDYTDEMETVSLMMETSINLLDYVLDDMHSNIENVVARSGRITTTLLVLGEQLSQIKAEQDNLVRKMIGADREEKVNE